MSLKYHIKPDGTVGVCKAERGGCPYQSAPHFESEEDAQNYIHDQGEREYGILPYEEGKDNYADLLSDEKTAMERTLSSVETFIERAKDKIESCENVLINTERSLTEAKKSGKSQKKIKAYEKRIEGASKRVSDLKTELENLLDEKRILKWDISKQDQRIYNYNNGIFFDSSLYRGDEDISEIADDAKYFLEKYTDQPRGEIKYYALLAKRSTNLDEQGGIEEGYRNISSNKLEDIVVQTLDEDRVYLKDNQGNLELVTIDYDGSNVCEVKPITKSTAKEYDTVAKTKNTENVVRFLKKIPSVKIKKSERLHKRS